MSEKQFNPSVEYRQVCGLSRYRIGSDGTIVSLNTGRWGVAKPRILSPSTLSNGYRGVWVFSDDHKKLSRTVHSLVLEAFVGPRPSGYVAMHLNANRSDNRPENLAWGTPKENSEDVVVRGKSPKGMRNGSRKLSEREVKHIRAMQLLGVSQSYIARRFEVSQSLVGLILRREIWTHI